MHTSERDSLTLLTQWQPLLQRTINAKQPLLRINETMRHIELTGNVFIANTMRDEQRENDVFIYQPSLFLPMNATSVKWNNPVKCDRENNFK